jgi:hypothetical protein
MLFTQTKPFKLYFIKSTLNVFFWFQLKDSPAEENKSKSQKQPMMATPTNSGKKLTLT